MGAVPRIVRTFLENYDFSGKTIVPFCTSGSSDIGSSARDLHNLTDGANWLDGRRFSSGTSRGTMVNWVNSLALDITAQLTTRHIIAKKTLFRGDKMRCWDLRGPLSRGSIMISKPRGNAEEITGRLGQSSHFLDWSIRGA